MNCCEFPNLANHKVTLRSQSLVADGYGGQTLTWTTVGTYWAWIRPVVVFVESERFAQDQRQSTLTHTVVIRYISDFKNTKDFSTYSMTFDGRTYSVLSIKNFDKTMKNYGTEFQEILTADNGPELVG